MNRILLILCILTTLATACTNPQPAPAAPIEVTRIVEVTRQVEITVPVEVTRQVETTRLIVATPTSAPTPAQQPAGLQPEDVIAAFQSAGLEAANVHQLEPSEYKLAPYVGWGLRFLLPSINPDNYGGRLFHVADPDKRAQLKTFYIEAGEASAILASYLYERDNILLQLPGDLPRQLADQYGAALQAAQPSAP